MPDNVVDAENTNTFKARLDKFLRNQEMSYDYRAELTGIGSRHSVVYSIEIRDTDIDVLAPASVKLVVLS